MFIRRVAIWLLFLAAIDVSTLAGAQEQPQAPADLPAAAEWKRHLEQDILPFWQTPAALGNPVGSFPSFRCNDGSLTDPQAPCGEFLSAPDWIRGAVGRQYVR